MSSCVYSWVSTRQPILCTNPLCFTCTLPNPASFSSLPTTKVSVYEGYFSDFLDFLMLEIRFGAQVYVPKRFLPVKYDYHRPLPLDMYTTECVICMLPIHEGRDEEDRHMITPCNHAFHSGCLTNWLNIKEECPTCRARLPPA